MSLEVELPLGILVEVVDELEEVDLCWRPLELCGWKMHEDGWDAGEIHLKGQREVFEE